MENKLKQQALEIILSDLEMSIFKDAPESSTERYVTQKIIQQFKRWELSTVEECLPYVNYMTKNLNYKPFENVSEIIPLWEDEDFIDIRIMPLSLDEFMQLKRKYQEVV